MDLGWCGTNWQYDRVELGSSTTLQLNGFNESIGALSGTGLVSLGSGNLTTSHTANTSFGGVISGSVHWSRADRVL